MTIETYVVIVVINASINLMHLNLGHMVLQDPKLWIPTDDDTYDDDFQIRLSSTSGVVVGGWHD